MEFRIAGNQHEIARENVIGATRNTPPEIGDGRNKYFIKLHGRQYPIKQVLRLVTGLGALEFTSQDAYRILTAVGFDISGRPSTEAVSIASPDGGEETLQMLVVFEADEDGWEVASCPTLPGCHSQGRTRDEARANIREAIRGYVASMREHGVATPSTPSFEVVDVSV